MYFVLKIYLIKMCFIHIRVLIVILIMIPAAFAFRPF
jgi:hypothetical protein